MFRRALALTSIQATPRPPLCVGAVTSGQASLSSLPRHRKLEAARRMRCRKVLGRGRMVHRQTSERQTSETTNVRTTNVRKDKRQKGQTSEATNVGSDKRQKDKHRKRQTSEATNIRKSQNLILLTFVWLILYKYKINHTKVNNLS